MKLALTYRLMIAYLIMNQWTLSISLDNGLALTPPMGWMTWLRYGCTTDCQVYPNECISETLIKNVVHLMVNEGYKDIGYEYVIIDDCWMESNRNSDGKLQPNRARFPNGLKYLAEYIHSKGLKFGIYENYGPKTCEGYPGIMEHLKEDAYTFAEWGVDYIKLDACFSMPETLHIGYSEFGKYLNETGRPMVYSCSWPAYLELSQSKISYESVKRICNLWRIFIDIKDSWPSILSIVDFYITKQNFIQPLAGPGHWNDPDMLTVGNYGLSYDQSKTQMALWAIMAAPLIISTDLRNIRPELKAILQNKRIIDVNQDYLGIQGKMIDTKDGIDTWIRPIMPIFDRNFSYAILFVNRRTDAMPYLYRTTLRNIGLHNPAGYRFYDLFSRSSNDSIFSFVSQPSHTLRMRINPTGVMFFRANVQHL